MSDRETVAEALKEAVSSGTSGVGQATYGGAGDPEEEDDEEDVEKEWTGPHEGPQGGTYWENTDTGEQRYQEDKPTEGSSGGDEGGGTESADAQSLRDISDELREENALDRENVLSALGREEPDFSDYNDYGIDGTDLATGVTSAIDEVNPETPEEFWEAVESGTFEDEIRDMYGLFSDPDDLNDIPKDVRDSIMQDAETRALAEMATQRPEGLLESTEEGEGEEPEGEEEGGEEVDYAEQYPSTDLHNVDPESVEEGDYLVVRERGSTKKMRVRDINVEENGAIVAEGLTPQGESAGFISTSDNYEILGKLPEGTSYESQVEESVQDAIGQYQETVDAVLDDFGKEQIRDGLEEMETRHGGEFQRLSNSAASDLRFAISEAVGDDEAVSELWARMNEMKQSSTGSQREYVDALAKATFDLEDAETWNDADPEDYDFSEKDKEAMAVTAAVSKEVLDAASDGTIHRGIGDGGSAQLAEAWLSDPMDTEFSIEENASANYSSVSEVAQGYGSITVDREVTEGSVLNANDLIRGMYRSSAAADEAEVWSSGAEQAVSSWDVSIGSKREQGESKRMYLGDYQEPIEEIDDEDFFYNMGRQIENWANSDEVGELEGDAARNLNVFAERAEEVTGSDRWKELASELTKEQTMEEESVDIDLTEEAGWMNALRDGDEKEEIASKAAAVVFKEWTGPHEGPRGGTYWQNPETGEKRYQESKPSEGGGGSGSAGGDSPDGRSGTNDLRSAAEEHISPSTADSLFSSERSREENLEILGEHLGEEKRAMVEAELSRTDGGEATNDDLLEVMEERMSARSVMELFSEDRSLEENLDIVEAYAGSETRRSLESAMEPSGGYSGEYDTATDRLNAYVQGDNKLPEGIESSDNDAVNRFAANALQVTEQIIKNEEVMDNLVSHISSFEESPRSSAGFNGDITLSEKARYSSTTHELAHALAHSYGYRVSRSAVERAYSNGANIPDLTQEDVRDSGNLLTGGEDAPEEVERLIEETNKVWKQAAQHAADGDKESVSVALVGMDYASNNAGETLTSFHEAIQSPDNEATAAQIADNHPGWWEAYTDLFEPPEGVA